MSGQSAARAALASIPGWADPDIAIERLPGGLNNDSYRITREARQFILRLPGGDARTFETECRVQAVAAERGLAPAVVQADTDSGVLISDYLPGRSWGQADLHDPHRLTALAELLGRVHELPESGVPFAAAAAASRYFADLPARHGDRAFAAHCVDIVRDTPAGGPRRCCHNDVVASNVIEGDDLRLIDWEYAGDNDPYFDLASIIGWHDLDTDRRDALLEAYAKRVDRETREHLAAQCRLFDALQWLWLAARQQRDTNHLSARLEIVRSRLSAQDPPP